MEVRTGSKDGARLASLQEIIAGIGPELRQQQKVWGEQLCQNPSCFGAIEVQVHHAFQNLADQVVAGLLAQVGRQPQLAEDVKKK